MTIKTKTRRKPAPRVHVASLGALTADTLALRKILDRAVEEGDCMIWRGKVNRAGQPCLADTTARRRVWELARGPISAGMQVSFDCGCRRCINPGHLLLRTRSEVSRASLSRPHVKARLVASSTRSAHASKGKITMAIAREIRASTKTGKQLAAELACSDSLISLVRRNKSWVEPGNPWAGLGGRVA